MSTTSNNTSDPIHVNSSIANQGSTQMNQMKKKTDLHRRKSNAQNAKIINEFILEGKEHAMKALQSFEAAGMGAMFCLGGSISASHIDVGRIYTTSNMMKLEHYGPIISETLSFKQLPPQKYEELEYLKISAELLKDKYGINEGTGTLSKMNKSKLVEVVKENWYDTGFPMATRLCELVQNSSTAADVSANSLSKREVTTFAHKMSKKRPHSVDKHLCGTEFTKSKKPKCTLRGKIR